MGAKSNQHDSSPQPPEPFEERLAKWMMVGFGVPIVLLIALAILHALMGMAGVITLAAIIGVAAVPAASFWYRAKRPESAAPKASSASRSFPSSSRASEPPPANSGPRLPARRSRKAIPAEPRFYGRGQSLALPSGTCSDPLTYAAGERLARPFDPSLIELPLKVDTATPFDAVPPLPYWPSYREATPAQRGVYLQWLLGNRRDPDVPIGYVFIYFYGLERRVMVDQKDHRRVAKEVIRLLSIYGEQNNSFRRYALRFLWFAITLGLQQEVIEQKVLDAAMRLPGRWDEDALAMCLDVLHELGQPLPKHLARRIAERDERTTRSVVMRRNPEEFDKLFAAKYEQQFAKGIALRAGKRPVRLTYEPASAQLSREAGTVINAEVADILAIRSQFKPLVRLWDECVEELRGYDRARRRADEEELTAEMYEQLPEELRSGDHPEFDAWWQIKSRYADDHGWSIVPASELAELKGIEPRKKLTQAQCKRILNSADGMGLGLEPDARITGRNYRWSEPVVLFVLQHDEHPSGRYLAAATLLRLGMIVAEADGQVDEQELSRITDHLEKVLELSDVESSRLELLQVLLEREGAGYELLTKSLVESLSKAHRHLIGDYLVGVAAADGTITDHERTALKKVFRKLDLDPADLDELLAEVEAPADEPVEIQPAGAKQQGEPIPSQGAAKSPGFALDAERIRTIMGETREVAEILTEAMTVEEVEEEEDEGPMPQSSTPAAVDDPTSATSPSSSAATVVADPSGEAADSVASRDEGAANATPDARAAQQTTAATDANAAAASNASAIDMSELAPRFHPFVKAVIQRDHWPQSELRALADEHNLMLVGAVDEVNEWAEVTFGDRLIEEDDSHYQVHTNLLEG